MPSVTVVTACDSASWGLGDDVARMLRAVDYLTGLSAVVTRDDEAV